MEPNDSLPKPTDHTLPAKQEILVQAKYHPELPQRQVRRFRSRKRLAIVLFIATCISTFLVGMNAGGGLPDPQRLMESTPAQARQLIIDGLSYMIPLMLILFSHEMGHYLQARRYGVPATLPFFIPMPIVPFGTMGAVIVQGAGVADRKSLFDIAISGPLAGLVFALPFTYWGMSNATIVALPPNVDVLIYSDPLVMKWMLQSIHGPIGVGYEVSLTPMLFAGWVGIFITALNLIPVGQLDGGHIMYTLIGRRAHQVAIGLLMLAVGFMIYARYPAFGLMVVLLVLMGPKHPPTADDSVPLGRFRKILGWLTLSFVFVGFTPMPLKMVTVEERQAAQGLEVDAGSGQASGQTGVANDE